MKIVKYGAFYRKVLIQNSNRALGQMLLAHITAEPGSDMFRDGCKADTWKDPETSVHSFLCLPQRKWSLLSLILEFFQYQDVIWWVGKERQTARVKAAHMIHSAAWGLTLRVVSPGKTLRQQMLN